jgi:hypothetical protein
MKFNVTVTIKENISDKEKTDRLNQFQQSFVEAAAGYYSSGQQTPPQKIIYEKQESA